jgi:peptidyl-prolyl cis-trans isomerase C
MLKVEPMAQGVARFALGLALVASGPMVLGGCDDSAPVSTGADAGAPPAGLTPQQAAAVIAKVGDETITLGEFAAVLERMNQMDRLRFQSKPRRQALLQDLIDIKLLAQEARRRGLDKKPEVRDAIRQILRDAILAKARQGMRSPAEIPATEVKAYYDEHRDTYREPERRRVSAIVLKDEDKAAEALDKALAIKTGEQWGVLFHKYSVTAPKKRNPRAPADLAGDLGIVGPPGDAKGTSKSVPPEVQTAVFGLAEVGDVHNQVVAAADGRYFIVRLAGRSKGHTRSLVEADRAIRVAILQANIRKREIQMAADLRQRFPVEIDKDALATIKLPGQLKQEPSLWQPDGAPSSSGKADRSAKPKEAPSPGPATGPSSEPKAPPSASSAP